MHIGPVAAPTACELLSRCYEHLPSKLDLYFERFFKSESKKSARFDIDWSWKERGYYSTFFYPMVESCGFGYQCKFKYRSIFREVGKSFWFAQKNWMHWQNPRLITTIWSVCGCAW
jgi:hypothetical protein